MTSGRFRSKKSAAMVLDGLRKGAGGATSAMLELADRCNEVCVHCYQVQGQKGEMSTAEAKQLLDQLAEMGVLFLTLSGGEVTLRHDFLELVAYAREKRFAVKIYTNGLTMTPELAGELARLSVQEVHVSLYSHRAEVHDWVTRVPGAFDRTVAAIRHLVAVGLSVVMKSPLMSFNAGDLDDYIAFAEELGVLYSLDPELKPREDGDRAPEAFAMTEAQYLRLRSDPRFALAATPPEVPETASPCGACRGNVHVEANGEVRPCAMLDISLGNARTEPVGETWARHPAAAAIRALSWKDFHGCRDCDLRKHCHRCYENARRETGDAFGPYRTACRMARLDYGMRTVGAAPRVTGSGDPDVGPYREVVPGHLRRVPDQRTQEDEALREAHPWARQGGGQAPGAAGPGQLVQIRRPGRRPKAERVPRKGLAT